MILPERTVTAANAQLLRVRPYVLDTQGATAGEGQRTPSLLLAKELLKMGDRRQRGRRSENSQRLGTGGSTAGRPDRQTVGMRLSASAGGTRPRRCIRRCWLPGDVVGGDVLASTTVLRGSPWVVLTLNVHGLDAVLGHDIGDHVDRDGDTRGMQVRGIGGARCPTPLVRNTSWKSGSRPDWPEVQPGYSTLQVYAYAHGRRRECPPGGSSPTPGPRIYVRLAMRRGVPPLQQHRLIAAKPHLRQRQRPGGVRVGGADIRSAALTEGACRIVPHAHRGRCPNG